MNLEQKKLIRYLLISIFITLIDLGVVYILRFAFNQNLVFSNTIGVITGCVVQYFLTMRHVFEREKNSLSAIIFFGTFFVGLLLADVTIYVVHELLDTTFSEKLVFLISKGFSMVVPFFVLYYLRRYLYDRFQPRS